MRYQTFRSVSDHHMFVVCRDGTFYALVPETCASRSRGRACSVGRSRNSRHTNAGRSRLFRHRSKSSGKDGLLSIGALWFWLQDYLDHAYLDHTYGVKEGDQPRSSSLGGSVPSGVIDSTSQMAEEGIDSGIAS